MSCQGKSGWSSGRDIISNVRLNTLKHKTYLRRGSDFVEDKEQVLQQDAVHPWQRRGETAVRERENIIIMAIVITSTVANNLIVITIAITSLSKEGRAMFP